MMAAIRVLIVDDSPTARLALRAIVEHDKSIEVVAEASNTRQALRALEAHKPDLVLLDVLLASEDGIALASEIMSQQPVPIIIVTGMDPTYPQLVYRAMEAGALELFGKPPGPRHPRYEKARKDLCQLIHRLARLPVITRRSSRRDRQTDRRRSSTSTTSETAQIAPGSREQTNARTSSRGSAPEGPRRSQVRLAGETPRRGPIDLVVVGASTGGPPALKVLLDGFPRPLPCPIVIAQHMSPGFVRGFAKWFGTRTDRRVETVSGRQAMEDDTVYFADEDLHVAISGRFVVEDAQPPIRYHRPSIDHLFTTAATSHGRRLLAVLLTGMGSDGAVGLGAVREHGGMTVVQDPETCVVAGMPNSALERGVVDATLRLERIGTWASEPPHPTDLGVTR